MPRDGTSNQIVYLQIESDSNYYNTAEQIRVRNTRTFADSFAPSLISGSNVATGFFSGRRMIPDPVVYNSATYPTSSTVIDDSGNPRPILSLNIDYYASSSVDIYRQGVEISDQKKWTNGIAKITAGTPGHLYDGYRYGISEISIIDPDKFYEIEVFDPIKFVETGGDPDLFIYPIITSDSNQLENYVLNGIIEPFPIRPVISNFSINFPFEPHSFRGDFNNGNLNHRFATDEVLSVDYYEPTKQNVQMFLDAVDYVTLGSGSNAGGNFAEYLLLDENNVTYFEDVVPPRGYINSASYPDDLLNVIYSMPPGGTTYVTNKQRSATCGFVYDDVATQGTDSIAFGGMLY